jgi:hypothetical protein
MDHPFTVSRYSHNGLVLFPDTKFCEACKSIFSGNPDRFNWNSMFNNKRFTHQETYQNLDAAARDDCYICWRLSRLIDPTFAEDAATLLPEEGTSFTTYTLSCHGSRQPSGMEFILLSIHIGLLLGFSEAARKKLDRMYTSFVIFSSSSMCDNPIRAMACQFRLIRARVSLYQKVVSKSGT